MADPPRRRPGGAAVSDAETIAAMRSLDAAGIPSGESGAAALAGAMALAEGRAAADALLGATTTVVLFDTEGVTDPERYAAIVSGRC